MGEVIELAPYLSLRSRQFPESPEAQPARAGRCESCALRAAAAEVFRSDAVAAGLGGRLQCARCLAAELRRGRCGPDARRAEARLAWRLRGAEHSIAIRIDWDVRQGRARALDGVPLE
jgi:hypothetical protein